MISIDLIEGWFSKTWSRPSCSKVGWLKLGLDRLGRLLVHYNLISTVMVDYSFIKTWSQKSCSMAGSLKLGLDRLGRLLVHLNLISTVLVDGWFTKTSTQPTCSLAGHWNFVLNARVDWCFTKPWSRRSGPIAGSLKLDLDSLGRWLVH